jgi:hypothetical protein
LVSWVQLLLPLALLPTLRTTLSLRLSNYEVRTMSMQPREPTTKWRLYKRHTAFFVTHSGGTCYRVRIRWSGKLGLELDYDLHSTFEAQRVCERINNVRYIEPSRWRRVYYPDRAPSWSSSLHARQRSLPLVVR